MKISRLGKAAHQGGVVNEKGMTLMELLVVVAMVAIIAGIAMLNTGGLRQTYQVKAAAREVFGDMQRARLAAIREGRKYMMCFSSADAFTAYTLQKSGPNTTSCDADDEIVTSKDMSALFRGISFEENFSGTVASFFPTGTASSGNVTITVGGKEKVITVNQFTGNVRIE